MSLDEPIPECLACTKPEENYVFVFGSNARAQHGAGAARHAEQFHGASRKIPFGLSGQSFAIPTKDEWIQTLPLAVIRDYVLKFIEFAKANPDKKFFLTSIGTGLAGFSHIQMAPLFNNCSSNVRLPDVWQIQDKP